MQCACVKLICMCEVSLVAFSARQVRSRTTAIVVTKSPSHPSLKTNFITLKVAGTCDTSVGEILNIPIPLNKILDSIEGRGYGAKHRDGLQNILSVVFEGHY